jgi:hypothetical protein
VKTSRRFAVRPVTQSQLIGSGQSDNVAFNNGRNMAGHELKFDGDCLNEQPCCFPRHPEGFCASSRHRDIILFQQRLKSVIMKEWKQLRARNEDTTIDSNRS